ncbi:MAG: PIG-L family deacetylase [Candidatus Aminicenantales bacterium]
MKRDVCIIIGAALILSGAATAPRIETWNAAELQIAVGKLNVLGSVLYIAAHPDDENTSVLAYLSKGKKYRTAYLSLTRGDGGQNLIGPEKGAEIGILRTQELLSARRFDGAEQYFTRAVDFGYSKTAEETFTFWDREAVLSDIVRVIRTFRPDVIASRFPVEGGGGHGHHTASGILVREAFRAAADPKMFPEQLKKLRPWKADRLVWNSFRPNAEEAARWIRVDIGAYDPLIGKSFSEIAADSRSQHRSQGFGAAGRRGTAYDYFQIEGGAPGVRDLFEGIDTSWDRVPGGGSVGRALGEVAASFDPRTPSKSLPLLLKAYAELGRLAENEWVGIKRREILAVIQACAGLWMEAIAGDFSGVPGEEVKIAATFVNRSDQDFRLRKISFPGLAPDEEMDVPLEYNRPGTVEKTVRIPGDYPISQPYWLEAEPGRGMYSVSGPDLIGAAENPPSIRVNVAIAASGNVLEYSLPLLFRRTDRAEGEIYRDFEVRPPVTIRFENKVNIFADHQPKDIKVVIRSHSRNVSGSLRLKGSGAWRIEPASVTFSLPGKNEEKSVSFRVTPPSSADASAFVAEAEVGGKSYDRDLVEIAYPHIRPQVYFPPSRAKMVRLDIRVPGGRIGYIMGAGDEVADSLRALGYEITLLSDDMLENADLARFDAIVAGIRAVNTRERLKAAQPRLLRYVENGGTLIIQYVVPAGPTTENLGPYPFTVGRERVNMEDAPVTFLAPNHPLLNFPNAITQRDFEGWVQERGLYFASTWDDRYETVWSSHDAGEPDLKGGTLFARYGKGVYIFSGYAWFRQLPDGVPGAFRLFVNMLSAGKSHE